VLFVAYRCKGIKNRAILGCAAKEAKPENETGFASFFTDYVWKYVIPI
jgi:hypothetical protein